MATPALAQPPEDAPAAPQAEGAAGIDLTQIRDVARAKAEEGLSLFGEQKWQPAFEAFQIAEGLFHAPTLTLFMGHCQREQRRLLEARELYRKVANEALPEDAPEAFLNAQQAAREHLAALKERIPRLLIHVSGRPLDQVKVTLNGQPVSLAPAEIEVNPGEHLVIATAKGVEAEERAVEAKESTVTRVALKLEPLSKAQPVLPPPPPPPEPGPLYPGLVGVAVGGAGLAVGGILGGIALQRVESIRAQCVDNRCPLSLVEERNTTILLARGSTISFIAGGALAAAGVVLLIVRPRFGGDGQDASAAGHDLSVGLGPQGALLRGAF